MKINHADIEWLIEQWQFAFSANWHPKDTQLETMGDDCDRLARHGDTLRKWFKRFVQARAGAQGTTRWPQFCVFMREQRKLECESTQYGRQPQPEQRTPEARARVSAMLSRAINRLAAKQRGGRSREAQETRVARGPVLITNERRKTLRQQAVELAEGEDVPEDEIPF